MRALRRALEPRTLSPQRRFWERRSTLDDDGLQIFARHDQRILARRVESLQQVRDVARQRGLFAGIERCEGFERGSVELAEHLQPMRARAIPKAEVFTHAANVGGL